MIEEVGELEDTIRKLELKGEQSEDRLRDLQHTRMALEKEINIKRNTIGTKKIIRIIDYDHWFKKAWWKLVNENFGVSKK